MPETVSHQGFSRRAFLTGAGAILGSALVLGPNGFPTPGALARLARAGGPRLSLGYVEGSAGLSVADAEALLASVGTRVTPAAALRSGAKRLVGRTATVRIGRLSPGAPAGEAAQLDVLVAPPRGAGNELLPFYAWTRRPGGSGGPSAAFATAVAAEPTLGLAMRVGTRDAWRESVAVFTGGREHGLPKLRPGLYLVGLDPDAWATGRTLPGGEHAVPASLALTVQEA